MAEYFAVMRLPGAATPKKMTFSAAGTISEAVIEMVKQANCTSTLGIEEYQLYEMLHHGHYRPVAQKFATQPVKALVPVAPVLQLEELVYTPYATTVA